METYNNYTIAFKPRSAVITPMQSDTLFGHLAWAIRYLKSETDLISFLNAYKDEGNPPLLISDGFRSGYLPKPLFRALPLSELKQVVNEVSEEINERIEESQFTSIIKALKKQKTISHASFSKLQANLTARALLKESLRELDWPVLLRKEQGKKPHSIAQVAMHNTVNRMSWTVTEGLFQTTETFYDAEVTFQAFLKTNYFSKEELEQLFNFIEYSGFGKDKSTGKGRFSISIDDKQTLSTPENCNAFMVLSHYIPNPHAPQKGYYKVMTKYGRLGGDYACSHITPFKKPLLMVQPGSVFFGKPALNYGLLLGGQTRPSSMHVHDMPEIRHYAYAYPLGLITDEEEFKT